ncbi:MAG: hypothetical protein HYZ13_05010 [Acidobacteria bacterium]|nr:hypothetical protein [Acidobacteriota bacterium]
MSGPLPLQAQGPLILEALRLVEGAPALEATLAATPGAEIKAVLAEISSQGLLLLLADGRSFTAAGKLPYPTGTELTFRVQPQADGTLQLKPLSADPPPPPALLAPLVQGEAASLLQRLAAVDLPGELMPLKALLDRLPVAPQAPAVALPPALAPLTEALGLARGVPGFPPPPSPTPGSSAALPAEALPSPPPTTPPTAASLTTALVARRVPPGPAAALATLLLGEPRLEAALEPAPAPREAVMRPLEGQAQGAPASLPAPLEGRTTQPPRTPSASPQTAPPAETVLDRALLKAFGLPDHLIQELLPTQAEGRPAATPAASAAEANVRLRQLLERLPPPLAQRVLVLLTLLPPAGHGQVLSSQDPLAQLIRSLLPQLPHPPAESPLAQASALVREGAAAPLSPSEPATWLRWIKEVASTLSRPEASPAEAPFHRLQAREGTALFEVPLPWRPDPGTLELWAERDAAGPGREEAHRVLLALNLGRTGELRVALQSGPAGILAQVVASPGVSARLEALLREELGEPAPFPLQVRAAPDLPPRPRALAGTGLQALG